MKAHIRRISKAIRHNKLLSAPSRGGDVKYCYKFIVTGDEAGSWVVDLTAQNYQIEEVDGDAQCIITISGDDLLDLVNGETSLEYLTQFPGILEVEGDIAAAGKLISLLLCDSYLTRPGRHTRTRSSNYVPAYER